MFTTAAGKSKIRHNKLTRRLFSVLHFRGSSGKNPGPAFDPELRPKGWPGFGSPRRGEAYRTGVWEGYACLFKAISQKKIPPDFTASQYLGFTPVRPLESSTVPEGQVS